MVSVVGMLVAVPVAVLVGSAFLAQGKVEDELTNYYAADAVVYAIVSDLKRGADPSPLPPHTYIPPLCGLRRRGPLYLVGRRGV
jgi:hypothetical protein